MIENFFSTVNLAFDYFLCIYFLVRVFCSPANNIIIFYILNFLLLLVTKTSVDNF
ncbi:hypothetical protein LLB_1879 [Legionella longbeachae D-4968]|nr:hypothetical protein LLB_1879 [Legionella longbeachae D-4968]